LNTKKKLQRIERDLNGIIAAITQVSGRRARRARRVTQIAAGKLAGVASIGGMLMFISAFGTASTGTAIGALSGAAATSAKMYWIGSLFGMGAVAGAIILPAIGFILGLVAVFFVSRALFGRPRTPERMQDFEVRSLFACMCMIEPVYRYLALKAPEPSQDELRIFAHEGLLPLLDLIGQHLNAPANDNETDKECPSFEETLALLPRRKLRRHQRRLRKLASKLAAQKKASRLHVWRLWSSRSPSSA
jgi:hypothetical protein